MIKFMLAIMIIINPLWPLGDNPRAGDPFIIINKSINKLAFINEGKIQKVYSVATGKTPKLTPEGLFNVVFKVKNPYFRKKKIPGGDPRNPLGSRWIGFDAENTDGTIYGIHGNNDPTSIGKYISNGCVRMRNEEVNELYEKVPIGTKVFIVNTSKSFEQLAKEKGAIR
ncbi:L,D-transpeptidase [Gottfriedia endophytica]